MKGLLLCALTLSVLVSGMANPVMATQRPFYATVQFDDEGAGVCRRIWVDEEGILHALGCLNTGVMSGDIDGTIEAVAKLNLLSFGEDGPIDGKAQLRGDITPEGESEASYLMTLHAVFEGGFISGKFAIHGIGSLEGVDASGTVTGNPADAPVELIGTITTRI